MIDSEVKGKPGVMQPGALINGIEIFYEKYNIVPVGFLD